MHQQSSNALEPNISPQLLQIHEKVVKTITVLINNVCSKFIMKMPNVQRKNYIQYVEHKKILILGPAYLGIHLYDPKKPKHPKYL